jgi:hypothetical protein
MQRGTAADSILENEKSGSVRNMNWVFYLAINNGNGTLFSLCWVQRGA